MSATQTKRLIFLTSGRSDAAPPERALFEAARKAGVTAAVGESSHFAAEIGAEGESDILAVLYEINEEAGTDELRRAVAHATSTWSGVPVIAYHPYEQRRENFNRHDHQTSTRLLKYLGFRAVIDAPEQLPQTLREIEEQRAAAQASSASSANNADDAAMPIERGEALLNLVRLPEKISAAHLRTAFEIVAALHYASDQKQAAQAALNGFARLIRADAWAIYHQSEEKGENEVLELLAAIGGGAAATGASHAPHEGRGKTCASGNLASVSPPPPPAPAMSVVAREAIETTESVRKTVAHRHLMAVPLMYGERLCGVIEAERITPAKPFKKADAALLTSLGVPLACALTNAGRIVKAEHLSVTDDLTKLHNARYLRQFLTGEIKRARRYNSPVAVIFLDLDDFKRINDVHGHLTGSHILTELAAVVARSVRDTDVVARYGGDEFVVVLPQSKAEQAVFVAERMREKIAHASFTGGRGLHLRVTASFGVAAFPQTALSPQQLIGAADQAMYQAKAAAKNCVRLAPEISADNLEENAFPA